MNKSDLLEGKNLAYANLGNVCVVGLGKTGNVVSEYICNLIGSRVKSLHVYAGEKKAYAMKAGDRLLSMGAELSFDDKKIIKEYDLCIISPGIPETSELMDSAKQCCKEVISEIEFAWRESRTDSTWVAITGTNGKTTTTSLITHILKAAGKHAVNVGNIGNVALEEVARDQMKSIYERNDIYVVEVSSYQLATSKYFAPDIAILLNITSDHISWHGSFEAYADAKLKVFDNAKIGIINGDDTYIQQNLETIKKFKLEELITNNHDDSQIIVQRKNSTNKIIDISDMKILGEHNCVNARAAASACLVLGLSDNQINSGIKSFKPLEHRLEPCGIVAGVRMFNDSKATNVDSVLVAINAFPDKNAIFLLGGKDKNTSLSELVDKSLKNLKGVVCYGQAADRFYSAFEEKVSGSSFILLKSKDMKSAFKEALERSFPGDYVVLSPACASFDEFDSFEHRGQVFKQLVEMCKQ